VTPLNKIKAEKLTRKGTNMKNCETNQKEGNRNICEMCGHSVEILQEAHIVSEKGKSKTNILLLCPTCHLMFDTHLKPRIYKAMLSIGINLPKSWEKSIYKQTTSEK